MRTHRMSKISRVRLKLFGFGADDDGVLFAGWLLFDVARATDA